MKNITIAQYLVKWAKELVTASPLEYEWFYHITFLRNLESIAEHGLEPGSGKSFRGGYEAHSQGKVFFTAWEGVSYWLHKFEYVAQDQSDSPAAEGFIPVVLAADLEDLEKLDDELGSKDSMQKAIYVKEKVPSDYMVYWDGHRWSELSDVDEDTAMNLREIAVQNSKMIKEDDDSEYEDTNFDTFKPNGPVTGID